MQIVSRRIHRYKLEEHEITYATDIVKSVLRDNVTFTILSQSSRK